MVVAVGALAAVWIRALKVNVGAHREADVIHCVASLENADAAVRRSYKRCPGLDEIVNERVIRPLGNLVANNDDVLRRPIGTAVGSVTSARQSVRGPGES